MVVESWGGVIPTVDNVFLGGRVWCEGGKGREGGREGGWEGVV